MLDTRIFGTKALAGYCLHCLMLAALPVQLVMALPFETGLVGHWKMEGNLQDSSAHGYDGLAQSSPVFSEGYIAQALEVTTEPEQRIELGNLDLNGSGFSSAAWIYLDAPNRDGRIISKAVGTGRRDHTWMFGLRRIPGNSAEYKLRLRLKIDGGLAEFTAEDQLIQLKTWTHVAATWDGETVKLFKNGDVVAQFSRSGTLAVDPDVAVAIGNQPAGAGDRSLRGKLDEVFLFERGLDEQEVRGLAYATLSAGSTSIGFPADSGIIDVTHPPYSISNDGTVDVTAAIQQILNDFPSQNKIIYFPQGEYLVSDTLEWAGSQKRTIFQGEDAAHTVIRLIDAAPGFQDKNNPKAVVFTGNPPAQRFRNAIRNLTINVGSGNPGAIGVQFMANNQGAMRDVQIISEDREGSIGLDISFNGQIGPALFKGIKVTGFDYGVRSRALNSATFEDLEVVDQKLAGIFNVQNGTTIRKFKSVNAVPAAINNGKTGALLSVLDATLTGGTPTTSALINHRHMYLRNVTQEGYGAILESDFGSPVYNAGTAIKEFVSTTPVSLFSTALQASLDLPIHDTPVVPYDEVAHWANVMDPQFAGGAVGDGVTDDTLAIQAAIDSGKPTVYFPNGYNFSFSNIYLRANVRRLIGTESRLKRGIIHFVEGEQPHVIIERLENLASSDPEDNILVRHSSSRNLIISSVTGFEIESSNATGKLFIEDLVCKSIRLDSPGQRIWARQLNVENPLEVNIHNNGSEFWLLGLKTEAGQTKVLTTGGGSTEIIGASFYGTTPEPPTEPALLSIDSRVSYANIRQFSFEGSFFENFVREVLQGEQRDVLRSEAGNVVGLFVGD